MIEVYQIDEETLRFWCVSTMVRINNLGYHLDFSPLVGLNMDGLPMIKKLSFRESLKICFNKDIVRFKELSIAYTYGDKMAELYVKGRKIKKIIKQHIKLTINRRH